MSYEVDKSFSDKYHPLYKEIIEEQFEGGTYERNPTQGDNKTIDKCIGIDGLLTMANGIRFSFQEKVRRFKKYSFFRRSRDYAFNMVKQSIQGIQYETDLIKCQANYIIYGFANRYDNGLIYWCIIDFDNLKKEVLRIGGWDKIPGSKLTNPYSDGSIITVMRIIPHKFMKQFIVKSSDYVPELLTFDIF